DRIDSIERPRSPHRTSPMDPTESHRRPTFRLRALVIATAFVAILLGHFIEARRWARRQPAFRAARALYRAAPRAQMKYRAAVGPGIRIGPEVETLSQRPPEADRRSPDAPSGRVFRRLGLSE